MDNKVTTKDVLELAIQREIEAHQLYSDLNKKMAEEAARDALQQLSREEQEHESILRQYLNGEIKEGTLKTDAVLDYKIAEHFNQPKITKNMRLKDIFLMAANREKVSHELYLTFAAVHPPGQVKSILEQLASQELGHKQRVENLFNEVAFPQTDGG